MQTTAEILTSSKYQNWETPPSLYEPLQWLNKQLTGQDCFDLDPATTLCNIPAQMHITQNGLYMAGGVHHPQVNNGLGVEWGGATTVFLNPPWVEAGRWMKKIKEQTVKYPHMHFYCVLPTKPGNVWFHDYVFSHRHYGAIYWVKGRRNFWRDGKEYMDPKNKTKKGSATLGVCYVYIGSLAANSHYLMCSDTFQSKIPGESVLL